MFVALSKFVVANGMEAQVKQAFAARPHFVDAAEGFLRMDVLSILKGLKLIPSATEMRYFEHVAS